MLVVTTFENNERNISKNIVKLNLKQNTNLYCIIFGLHICRGNIFLISLPDETKNSCVLTRLINKFNTTGWFQGHLSLSSFRD